MSQHERVVIETGTKRVFASAVDWPGWCRSAKSENEALELLSKYARRYRPVTNFASVNGVIEIADSFEVIERVRGTAITDFGVPTLAATIEAQPMTDDECERQIRLVRAVWHYFDDTMKGVSEELRKGPRGGGRDRQKLADHVYEAERSYARQIGVKTPKGGMDTPEGRAAHREAVCDAIREVNTNGGLPDKWPLRYFIRRATWHVMDHAWEMEDKDLTGEER